jgi:hypothetical protein
MMKLFRHIKKKTILERKLTLVNQIYQIQRELMKQQDNKAYVHTSVVRTAEDIG